MKQVLSRSILLSFFASLALLTACGDGESDFASQPSDDSSSSVCEDCDDASSSSGKENAKNSSSSRNDKSSDSSANSSSDSEGSSSSVADGQNSSANEQSGEAVIKYKAIRGVAQKGPFVSGSAVTLYELDGETFAQTGKKFTTKIYSNNGKFGISSITLASQYALLEVKGSFRNEVTDQTSSEAVTLNALTDLSDRDTVNINLLTHLEYKRTLYLVGTGVDVSSAKKQAEAEVLDAFGIKGEFASSEELDIFDTVESSGALLAVSVMMLGELSEAELAERLTKFAADIEKDGSWDDETTKAMIADWLRAKDLAGKLKSISTNIDKWNLGSAPEFEKYVRNFWYMNYGLGECGTGNKAEVKATANEQSATYGTQTRYICKNGAWVEAKDIEKDTYKWEAGEDGEIRAGDVTKKDYVYDGKTKAWRAATAIEAALGGCTEAREADINKNTGKVDGLWYICKNREWESNNLAVDTQGWSKGEDGELREGDSTGLFYKYDEALDQWLTATNNDTRLKLNGCTTNRTGEIGLDYYVCKKLEWYKANEVDFDINGEKCTDKDVGKIIDGAVTASKKYYCSANGWISLMDRWSWDVPKELRLNPEIAYDSITDSRDGNVYKIVTIGEQVWMAENLNYADSVATKSLLRRSWCYNRKAENCAVAGRLYVWSAVIDSVALYDGGNGAMCGDGKTCTLPERVQGICPDGWHLPTRSEWYTLKTTVEEIFSAEKLSGGTILKSQTGWSSGCYSKKCNGTDSFGFSGLPGGYKDKYGNFLEAVDGSGAFFWSASEYQEDKVTILNLSYDSDYAILAHKLKSSAYSVRCVKD